MKQRIENTQKCEFVLKLENNIVCQRFFSVRNFNNKATQSLDLHEAVTYVVDDIVRDLKLKTLFLLRFIVKSFFFLKTLFFLYFLYTTPFL